MFAAGVALRRVERVEGDVEPPADVRALAAEAEAEEIATHPKTAPAYMAQAVLEFNEQLERIGEVVVVVLVGALLATRSLAPEIVWLAPLVVLVVRPAAVLTGLLGARLSALQRLLVAWFGIRGIGSLYYLSFAITHGLEAPAADRIVDLVLALVALSILVHGISVTPLMDV
ncbi:MAG TPA: cation:proton antiporter, partial [Candidatus Limnocylindrales bacterium]|nr:cation:proton antiporter [Candidatus Limnocylindrales bacterium]